MGGVMAEKKRMNWRAGQEGRKRKGKLGVLCTLVCLQEWTGRRKTATGTCISV